MSGHRKTARGGNAEAEVEAAYVPRDIRLDAAHPGAEWQLATPIAFSSDWQGKNPDLKRETQVRMLWSPRMLFLRFECCYRELYVFAQAETNGRRDRLWNRDVAEAFLQPEPAQDRYYKEFEVSPNGMWIDLDIFPGGLGNLQSGLQRSVVIHYQEHVWIAEVAVPMKAITPDFDPDKVWRANFFRVEGRKESRAYMAWRPTYTSKPNFHVPSAFGRLRFAAAC
jgi:alpha-galactosidase